MLDLDPFIAELRANIAAVLPQCLTGGGIREAEHADKVPWTDLVTPYGVILASNFQRAGDFGLTADAYWCDVELFYVTDVPGASGSLRRALELLEARFWPVDPLTTGQVWDVDGWDYGDHLEPNMKFRDALRSQRAGVLRMTCLVG